MPTPDTYPSLEYGGPRWLRCHRAEPEFAVVTGPKFVDGGQDTFLSFTNPTRRWVIEYDLLDESEADILDNHYASAYGPHLGFDFTDPETGALYTNVKYEKYERRAHEKAWIQSRTVQLIKRP